jgi:hypothetical protein
LRFTSQTIADALRSASQTGAQELTKPQHRQLASLGHLIERFAAACDQLRKRAEKMPELAPWLHELADAESCLLGGEGWFASAVTLGADRKLRVPASVVDRDVTAPLVDAWNRFHPDGQLPADAAIAAPPALRAAVWPALLRLRPLRDFWERALRRDALEALMQILPDAWLLDPAPLPPGAVIPRLELASWEAFAPAESSSSVAFSTSPAASDQQTPVHNSADLLAPLRGFPHAPHILTAHPSPTTPSLILSVYQRKANRTDWLGALALTSADSQPRIAHVG